ncbi:hypothetical protein [Streptomyces sp. S.PB5]|uniref:hypothetical protein n=1 Tax=Streptomyces sp. S.PB5 TaxID=3020844 RepID=UPI0025AFA083|nr:hypothetical protein [Streptomyces sp. S.PB5]MDN3025273.1 hypothetical protein [Streptomyces sp. S.PB5]
MVAEAAVDAGRVALLSLGEEEADVGEGGGEEMAPPAPQRAAIMAIVMKDVEMSWIA